MIEIAANSENCGIFQKDIAKKQEISEKYLDPIISSLKKAELIVNFKGKKSGYILNKSASEINVLMIIRAMGDNFDVVECVGPNPLCAKINACPCRPMWNGLNNVIANYLKSWFLSELVTKYKETNKIPEDQMMFFI